MTTATDIAPVDPVGERHPLRTARLAFRHWRHTRPFWAGLWALLGGALIAYVPGTAFKFFLLSNSSLIVGVGVGALVAVFGLMLWFLSQLRVILGIFILLLSLISFFTSDFGGLLLGMLMGLVGGSLALAWVPTKVTWRQRRRARTAPAATTPTTAPAPATESAIAPAPEPPSVAEEPGRPRPRLEDALFGEPDSAPEAGPRPFPPTEVTVHEGGVSRTDSTPQPHHPTPQ